MPLGQNAARPGFMSWRPVLSHRTCPKRALRLVWCFAVTVLKFIITFKQMSPQLCGQSWTHPLADRAFWETVRRAPAGHWGGKAGSIGGSWSSHEKSKWEMADLSIALECTHVVRSGWASPSSFLQRGEKLVNLGCTGKWDYPHITESIKAEWSAQGPTAYEWQTRDSSPGLWFPRPKPSLLYRAASRPVLHTMQQTWVWVLGLLPMCCVFFNKGLTLSEPLTPGSTEGVDKL